MPFRVYVVLGKKLWLLTSSSNIITSEVLLQVGGLIRLTSGAVLSFGLAHFSSSEFELMAEELLMSDSVIKVSRTRKFLFHGSIVPFYMSKKNSTFLLGFCCLLHF